MLSIYWRLGKRKWLNLTRRDLIKGGIAIAGVTPATPQTSQQRSVRLADAAQIVTGRERLLLDFGWRFHLGNADKETDDFNLGTERQDVRQVRQHWSGPPRRTSTTAPGRRSICRTIGPSNCRFMKTNRSSSTARNRSAAIIRTPASGGTGASSIFRHAIADDGCASNSTACSATPW